MLMKKIFILLTACAVVSCSKEADTPVSGASAPVRIDPTITRATEVDFETGDAVGLTITTADGLYAENTERSSRWPRTSVPGDTALRT